MNEIFTKIGGYIASGDTMVNHDNTLSGNGTVASPLSVVPGYNETVLWEGSYDNNGFTTTDKCGNFEYLIVNFSRGNSMSYTNLVKGSDSLIAYGGALYDIDEGAKFQEVVATVSSNNGTDWNTVGYQRRWNAGTTAIGGMTGTNINYITQIVGINRIANN